MVNISPPRREHQGRPPPNPGQGESIDDRLPIKTRQIYRENLREINEPEGHTKTNKNEAGT